MDHRMPTTIVGAIAATVSGNSAAAIIGAVAGAVVTLATALGIVYALYRRVRKDVTDELTDQRHHVEAQVIKANGVPLKLLESSPIPQWCKGVDGKMKLINFAYSQAFNVRPEDYVGRTDREVWPLAVAIAFANHDQEVAQSGRRIQFHETVPADRQNPEGEQIRLFVEKYPVWNAARTEIVGVGGWCVWPELIERMAGQAGLWTEPGLFREDSKA